MWGRAISIAGADASALSLALLVVFAIHVPTLDDYFHGDDFLAFIDLTTLPALTQLEQVFTFSDSNIYWRPLGQVYYLTIYRTAGLDPFFFHLASVLVFLATLALLYAFVLRFGLGRAVALGSVLVFGLLPNHAVSVAWVTNAPRLIAVLFVLVSLLLVQESLRSGRRRFEAAAFVAIFLAILADEVALVLTPLPVLYALLAQPSRSLIAPQHLLRGVAYGALGLSMAALQLTVGRTEQDAPAALSLNQVGVGWHIPRDFWALASKLVLPLTDGVGIETISVAQWVAGAMALLAAAVLLLLGTRRVRLLVLWTLLALAPFSLWTAPIAPARYTYMAAVPFALLLSWAVVALAGAAVRTHSFKVVRQLSLAPAATALALVALAAVGAWSAKATIDRNETWARESAPYEILAEELPRALPHVTPGSRLVLYYGVWPGFAVWQDAVVQTVYRDRSLHTVNVDRATTDSGEFPRGPNDVAIFYTDQGFLVPAATPSVR